MKRILPLIGFAGLAACGFAVDLTPSVNFDFNNSLTDSVSGVTAGLRNTAGASGLGSAVGTATFVDNVLLSDGSMDTVLSMSQFDFLSVDHQLLANGGGSFVNQYSILMDIKVPVESTWVSLFQTNTNNSNDGDYWIRDTDSLFGVDGNYTGAAVDRSEWNRIILAVDLTTSTINTYLNGDLARTQTIGGLDGRHSLDPTILILADNSGEMPSSAMLANLTIYGGTMGADQALALGGASAAVPEPATLALLGFGVAAIASRRKTRSQ